MFTTPRFWLHTSTEQPSDGGGDQQDGGFTPITTQDDLNKVISERLNRERAKYADYKDLKAKADQLDKIQSENQSETDRLANQIQQLQAQLDESNLTALRARVQASHQISDEDAGLFLTGTDEETLTRQATALAKRNDDKAKKGPYVPSQGNQPDPNQQGGELREFTRSLFGKK